jgi:PilZ domain-containing protein
MQALLPGQLSLVCAPLAVWGIVSDLGLLGQIVDGGLIPMADKSIPCDSALRKDWADKVSPDEETEIDRQYPRSELRGIASATIYPQDSESGEPVRCSVLTRDLSLAGFGIALTEKLKPRQRIELDVESKHFVGEVMWCREAQFGFYIAGCRLVAPR